jgi:co-chaperonin GroES (HSP10)
MSENVYVVLDNKLAMEATFNNVIVIEDKFKTGYECKTCDGAGHLGERCPSCEGTGFLGESACYNCGNTNEYSKRIYTGFVACKDCKGKGTSSGLVVPNNAERRPTTGSIVSVGPEVALNKDTGEPIFKLGDHVLFTQYSGHGITYKQNKTVRVLNEKEIITRLFRLKEANKLTEHEMGEVTA